MMNCEQYETLISTLIDDEIAADDRVTLDVHLSGCANCRAIEEGLRRQSADLRRAFTPHHRRASAVAERVSQQLCDEMARGRSRWLRPSLFAGIAAGFLLAVLAFQPWRVRNDTSVAGRAEPVGRLAFGTEPIELLHPGRPEWTNLYQGGQIPRGGSVRTGPEQVCEIVLPDGSQIRLNGLTEVQITDGRTVHLVRGELWGVPSRLDEPFVLYSLGQKITPSSPHINVAHDVSCLSLRQQSDAPFPSTVVAPFLPGDETVQFVIGRQRRTARLRDVVTQTRWMHPILAAKDQDPELARRVQYMFEKLAAVDEADDYEQEIRALGNQCIDALMSIVQSPGPSTDSAGRQRAARILSELSGPSRIPMLINLLGDRSPQVCSYAERALVRITGRTRDNVSSSVVGPAETTCGNPRGDWQAWWDENKHHYAQR